jgi:Cytochrome b5-like Heme/Steroid binding domain
MYHVCINGSGSSGRGECSEFLSLTYHRPAITMSSDDPQNPSPLLNGLEIAKHNTRDSCWVVISSYAYDVTAFLEEHPGGAAVILKYGGKVGNVTSYPTSLAQYLTAVQGRHHRIRTYPSKRHNRQIPRQRQTPGSSRYGYHLIPSQTSSHA